MKKLEYEKETRKLKYKFYKDIEDKKIYFYFYPKVRKMNILNIYNYITDDIFYKLFPKLGIKNILTSLERYSAFNMKKIKDKIEKYFKSEEGKLVLDKNNELYIRLEFKDEKEFENKKENIKEKIKSFYKEILNEFKRDLENLENLLENKIKEKARRRRLWQL